MARHLAGRAKALPSVQEQRDWERQRIAALHGGKAYYSIAPAFKQYFEFLREIAGPPAPGTTALAIPAFDDRWLEAWAGMVAPKIKAWKQERASAEESLEQGKIEARL